MCSHHRPPFSASITSHQCLQRKFFEMLFDVLKMGSDAGLVGSDPGRPHPRLLCWTFACCCLFLGFSWAFLTVSKKDNPVLNILHTLGQSHEQAATSR